MLEEAPPSSTPPASTSSRSPIRLRRRRPPRCLPPRRPRACSPSSPSTPTSGEYVSSRGRWGPSSPRSWWTWSACELSVGDGVDGMEIPVHPVGPSVWTRPVGEDDMDHECMRWLEQQPRRSVVYVSFGSGGTLTWEQTAELALGLELSKCRFIWAVKRPHQSSSNGAFFGTTQEGEDVSSLDFLPEAEGFMERTRGFGLVIQSWAPQTAILGHPSVGCFVTHCGWNSILESVTNGVPMVAWPLYAEQNMNAAMIEVQIGVAIWAKVGIDQFISREEVASAIQRVMIGEEAEKMRKRASELRDKSVHALSKEGCSTHTLAEIVNTWKCATRK